MLAAMNFLLSHLRNKLLAGALAAAPIVAVAYLVVLAEQYTKPLTQPLGYHFPGLGVLLAVGVVYLLGLLVSSLIGSWLLRGLDFALQRLPGLNMLYKVWKDVLVLPQGRAGMYDKVVLAPQPDGMSLRLGFTSADPVPGRPDCWCVFLPGVPNPIAGQLVFVQRDRCQVLALSVEEAFKFLLSSGNYLPPGLTPPQSSAVSSSAS